MTQLTDLLVNINSLEADLAKANLKHELSKRLHKQAHEKCGRPENTGAELESARTVCNAAKIAETEAWTVVQQIRSPCSQAREALLKHCLENSADADTILNS